MNPAAHSEWFSTIFGYGTAPDDVSRNYALAQLLSYPTVSVGAGYTKQIRYRTSLSIFGSWYNQKFSNAGVDPASGKNVDAVYHNQYDIYLQVLRKF